VQAEVDPAERDVLRDARREELVVGVLQHELNLLAQHGEPLRVRRTGTPSSSTAPEVGASAPTSNRNRVVLPPPLGSSRWPSRNSTAPRPVPVGWAHDPVTDGIFRAEAERTRRAEQQLRLRVLTDLADHGAGTVHDERRCGNGPRRGVQWWQVSLGDVHSGSRGRLGR
jgi:hypothetical protein